MVSPHLSLELDVDVFIFVNYSVFCAPAHAQCPLFVDIHCRRSDVRIVSIRRVFDNLRWLSVIARENSNGAVRCAQINSEIYGCSAHGWCG